MRSHFISIITLAFFVAFASPAAADEDEWAAFSEAYAAYQAVIDAQDKDAAVLAAESVLELGKPVFPDDSAHMASLYIRLGSAHQKAENHKEAVVALTDGLHRFEVLYGPKDKRLLAPLRMLAQSERFVDGGMGDARKLQRRALKIVADAYGKKSELFADASMELGELLYFSYRLSVPSMRSFEKAYDIYSQQDGPPNEKKARVAFWLGKVAIQKYRHDEAEEYFLEALDIFEKTDHSSQDLQVLAHKFLIILYERLGSSEKATPHCQAISRLLPLTGIDAFNPLYRVKPIYPRKEILNRRGGWVLVEFTVTSGGAVARTVIVESSGSRRFDEAAVDAVSRFRYAPAIENGELVETLGVRTLITFEYAY